MGKSAWAVLAIVLVLAGCGPGPDLTELASDPMAQLELDGTSIEHRIENDSGGSLMDKPTRASVTTEYTIGEGGDPDARPRGSC